MILLGFQSMGNWGVEIWGEYIRESFTFANQCQIVYLKIENLEREKMLILLFTFGILMNLGLCQTSKGHSAHNYIEVRPFDQTAKSRFRRNFDLTQFNMFQGFVGRPIGRGRTKTVPRTPDGFLC